jgi:hypothetical protein
MRSPLVALAGYRQTARHPAAILAQAPRGSRAGRFAFSQVNQRTRSQLSTRRVAPRTRICKVLCGGFRHE